MVTALPSATYSLARWRRQIIARRDPRIVDERKHFVATTFIDRSNCGSTFVEIDSLQMVLLFEDRNSAQGCHRALLRLVSYRASRVFHGIKWGGAENTGLFKDLTQVPQFGARGQRLDRSKTDLLSLALKLDSRLSRAARYPSAPWPEFRLPRMWAGFRRHVAPSLSAEGPEFEQSVLESGGSAAALLQSTARTEHGLVLFPLEWVGSRLNEAAAIFAEITPTLCRQVFRLNGLSEGLVGYQGAAEFDFYHSRYRQRAPVTYPRASRSLPNGAARLRLPRPTRERSPAMATLAG